MMDSNSPRKHPEEFVSDPTQAKPYKAEIVAELIDLDRDLMKQLVRRAKLVSRLRGGKDHAATPAAARAEKEVRTAWEKNAVAFSRDEKFARQLFSLLQEVRVVSLAEASARDTFNLSPARRPVSVSLPGPRSVLGTRMLAVLAAWFGEELVLENALFNDPLMDCVKALQYAGARFSWDVGARPGEGRLCHAASGGSTLSFATDKALYVGEDPFTLYLLSFLAASRTGRVRFTGGAALKMADLSPLRRFLPELGARFAHSVPKSNGLPGNVEASGVLPETVVVPADMPREGVMALFCAAAAWRKKLDIDCGALPLPLFTAALAECLPVLRACSVIDGMRGSVITVDATRAALPDSADAPLDPLLSAYLLALPVFAGGTVALSGRWDETLPLAASAVALLRQGGLAVQADGAGISASVSEADKAPVPCDLAAMDERLLPLGVAMAARQAWRHKTAVPLPRLPEGADLALVEGFFAHVGLANRDGMLAPAASPEAGEEKGSWTSPSPEWAFAYALCAYDRPNIRLTNPAVAGSLMPSFWALYNALPDPSEVRKAKEPEEEKKHRRIRTQ